MIAIMSISRAQQRRFYAKYQGLSRCVLEHDHSQLRPRSRHSAPLRTREAQRFADEVRRSRRLDQAATQLHTAGLHAAEVLKRLVSVRDAAVAVMAGAKQGVGADEAIVRMSELETLAALIAQSDQDAQARMPNLGATI